MDGIQIERVIFVFACLLYLHAGGAQQTPPFPIQAKDKGVGQSVERSRQDVQQGEREGRILWIGGVVDPGGERERENQEC